MPSVDVAAMIQSLQSWGQMSQVTSMIVQRLEASPLGAVRAGGAAPAPAAGGRRRKGAAAEAAAPAAEDPRARLPAIQAASQALDYADALLVRSISECNASRATRPA